MDFGSETFFQRLRDGMLASADDTFYSGVLAGIEHDIRPRVASMVTHPDEDDVVQQILLAVWISLPKFVRTSSGLSPAQRNAWLLRIVNNKIADYFRTRYTSKEELIIDDNQECSAPATFDPYVSLESDENNQIDEERIDNLINYVCSLNILPEKIIAFLYSKVIFFLNSGGKLKGSAKYAYDVLNGKRFCDVMPALQADLDAALGRPVPKSVYDMLLKKIGLDNMNCLLQIELQTITDSTSYIIKRVRKYDQLRSR